MKRTTGLHLAALLTASILVVGLPSCGGGGGCSGPLCGDDGTGPTVDPPGAPSNLDVSLEKNTATVTWAAGSGATSHRVEASTPGESTRTQTVNQGTTVTMSGLSAETTYSFQVIAVNTAGETPSQRVQATIPSADPEIRVQVTVDDNAVEGGVVRLFAADGNTLLREEETSAQGRVLFGDLDIGTYWVRFVASDFLATFVVAERELDAGEFDQIDVEFAGNTDYITITPHVALEPLAGTRGSRRVMVLSVPGASGAVVEADALDAEVVGAALAGPAKEEYDQGSAGSSAVPSTTLTVQLSGGQGDADLCATSADNSQGDCSVGGTNDEFLSFENPTPGTWVVVIDGYESYTGTSLLAEVPSTAPTVADLELFSRPDPAEACSAEFQGDAHTLVFDWNDPNGDVTLDGGSILQLWINDESYGDWVPIDITNDTPVAGKVYFGVCWQNPLNEGVDYRVSLLDDEGFESNELERTVLPPNSSSPPAAAGRGEGGSGGTVNAAARPLR